MTAMGPPPFPVDPSLDPWNNTSIIPLELDGLLYPSNGLVPLLHERPPLPGPSGSATHTPEFQLPSIRDPGSVRDPDSVAQWNNDPTAPWTSLRNTGSTGQSMIYQPNPQRPSPGMNLPDYREPSRSEVSGTTTGRYQLDSTYGTRSLVSNSEGSLDHPNQSQGCSSVAVDFNGLNFNHRGRSTASQDEHFSSLDGSSDTSQQPRAPVSLACQYEDCSHISKNNSEYK